MRSLIAITRDVSPSINDCELSFRERQSIDFTLAVAQHQAYRDCLAELGAKVVSLPAVSGLPDAVFVEDPAVVLDEVAIIANMGAASRRPEAKSLAEVLAHYRPLKFLVEPATLDGGDVLRIGRSLFVGLTKRTNREAIEQLRQLLVPYDYEVHDIRVHGCLHFKSACTYLGSQRVLINRSCVDTKLLDAFELIEVAADEPNAANTLFFNGTVIMPSSFPKTQALLERRGLRVRPIDVTELQKAEAGVTCCSLIFLGV